MKKPPKIFCSFCGRHSNEVLVIPGPSEANICVDCAKQIVEIINEAEANEVRDAILSGWITTGPRTKKLEKTIAEYVGVEKSVCLNSATAAMEMVLHLLGVGPGDEVIVPAYTYTATASVVRHVGATVVMVDSQKDCVEMDYTQLEKAITERTKVIVPVDLGGIVADYDINKTYWAFYINGEYAFSGVDTTPVEQGATYSFKVEK